MRKTIIYIVLLATVLAACSRSDDHIVIGVSQCSADIWREKQNAELRMGAYFHGNVELRFAAAYDSDERQVQQIDSLVATGIDLLIVAPNQLQTISPAIDRAYDRGIPVIVFERKTSSQKHTAFISADNYEMGHVMGDYIASRLHGQGTVLEIKGLEGSSPAIERHNGFMEALKGTPGVNVAAALQGDWTEETAYEVTKQWIESHADVHVDLVFGANDRTAMGARKAFSEMLQRGLHRQQGGDTPTLPLFCGIDGLPGENGGIQLVRDSLLDASYIYPTHGDQIVDLAVNILEGKPYSKETLMMSAIVTHDNAKVLLMQSDEIMKQAARLDLLHDKADSYLRELDTQRVVSWLALGIIVLLVVVIVLFYLYHLRKIAMQHERVVSTLWSMSSTVVPAAPAAPEASAAPEAPEVPAASDVPIAPAPSDVPVAPEAPAPPVAPEASVAPAPRDLFLSSFRAEVESRLSDSSLSVDDLASAMNLSRVQLYRKVKAISGSSPVELLRTARLKRAYQLLLTTGKSVSEVAYAVGFTAPSYFTKCFKEEYGMVPGEVRK